MDKNKNINNTSNAGYCEEANGKKSINRLAFLILTIQAVVLSTFMSVYMIINVGPGGFTVQDIVILVPSIFTTIMGTATTLKLVQKGQETKQSKS